MVSVDKKVTGGANKARQGKVPRALGLCLFSTLQNSFIGTDHQRIAKLDRENEVAPPPKVSPSVGRVRS